VLPALRRLADRGGGFDPIFRRALAQAGGDVGNQRRPLEASERAERDARGHGVAAVDARSNSREVVRGRRPPILGLQDREP